MYKYRIIFSAVDPRTGKHQQHRIGVDSPYVGRTIIDLLWADSFFIIGDNLIPKFASLSIESSGAIVYKLQRA